MRPGIGIADIQQPDPNGFVITLTNGKTHRIELAAGRDGAPGASPAKTARMAVRALLEARGETREALLLADRGIPGDPGADGIGIDSAIVSAQGNLLIGLTDGTIVDAGRVVGPPGVGERGPVGLPGKSGTDDGPPCCLALVRRLGLMTARMATTGSTSAPLSTASHKRTSVILDEWLGPSGWQFGGR